jgi:hypothetical protein|tara:strand:- start:7798 stop:7971 length:174 start_codon:yes stop_codon:yes gene_type:complete
MAAVPAPLSFTEICSYAQMYDVEDFDRFFLLLKTMDATYLESSLKKSGTEKVKKDAR